MFPTKWKAEVALEVFSEGGRVPDYWKKQRECALTRPKRVPWRVTERLKRALQIIEKLNSTCEEMKKYGKNADYDAVTFSKAEGYFAPRLDDTWGLKKGGRVHIDIGCKKYHLMRDKDYAEDFIEFIKNKRNFHDP